MKDYDTVVRRVRDAATRFRTAAWILKAGEPVNDAEKWLLGNQAGWLLDRALQDCQLLVPVLNDGSEDEVFALEGLEREVDNLYLALRKRRRARLLDDTRGRTAEEAEAFAAKARELRGGG